MSHKVSGIFTDKNWTLFLDRDGVINEKLENGYVKNWSEFRFVENSKKAIAGLSTFFGRIFIVTNQRGVGLGLMSESDLTDIHEKMLLEIYKESGRIDKIYYCVDKDNRAKCRKPNIGMGLLAKNDFPEIEFSKSIVVGDSISDMEFGQKLGMLTVFIGKSKTQFESKISSSFDSLFSFYDSLKFSDESR